MIPFVFLTALIFLGTIIAAIYFLGIRPSRIIEKWAAGLSNGGHFPERPNVKWIFWLIPVHREMQRIMEKIEGLKKTISDTEAAQVEKDFLENCVLASLMEGILVIDRQGVVVLVNAEFMNVFQLTQSPLRRSVLEAVRHPELHQLFLEAMQSGRVQSSRLKLPSTAATGRRPVVEVCMVPIRARPDQIKGVIVIIMAPADRPRLVQAMKRHSLRLDNLVSELLLTNGGGGESIQLKKESLDVREFLEDAVSVFTSKPKNNGIRADWKAEGDLPRLWVDASYLELGLVQLLDNVVADLELSPLPPAPSGRGDQGHPAVESAGVTIMAEAMPESIVLRVTFFGGSIPEDELTRAFNRPLAPRDNGEPPVVGSTSSLSLVREILDLHGAKLAVSSQENQVEILLTFPHSSQSDVSTASVPVAG